MVEEKRAAEEAELRRQEDERMRSDYDRRAVEEVREQRRQREAEMAARLREERQGERMVMRISKRCIGPGCNWRAEKDERCKHVTCKYPTERHTGSRMPLILVTLIRYQMCIRVLLDMQKTVGGWPSVG